MNPISRLLTTPVTISRPTASGVDGYGDETTTTASTQTVGHLQQGTSKESDSDQVIHEGWRLYLAPGELLDAHDTVTVAGLTYEVDGNPWPVVRPRTGRVHHIEAKLVRTS